MNRLISVHWLVIPSTTLLVMAHHGLSLFFLNVGSEDYDEIPRKQPKTETKQDYEEWKRRILENAAKAQETNSGSVSIVPPCNITTACS